MPRLWVPMAVLAGCLPWSAAAADPPTDLRPLTTAPYPGLSVARGAFAPTVSADGASVAFLSPGNNVVPEDNYRSWVDVFWQDLATGETRLVSVNREGSGGGNGHSISPSLSFNGLRIAFASQADDLVPGDTNQAADIFLRDVMSGETILVSEQNGAPGAGPGPGRNLPLCAHPILSADGGIVAYETHATNLTAWPDANGAVDVILRDLQASTNVLVSLNAAGTAASSGASRLAGMSTDGSKVLFTSVATDLVAGAAHGRRQVYRRDVTTRETLWVSEQASGWYGHAVDFLDPVMSAEGRVIAFKGQPDSASSLVLIVADAASGESLLLTNGVSWLHPLSLDDSGTRLACTDDVNVFVWDLPGPGLHFSTSFPPPVADTDPRAVSPVLTPDGRYLAFPSSDTNLVEEPTHGVFQAYLHDLLTGTTTLASRGASGQAQRGAIEVYPVVPLPEGGGVVFESPDPALVEGDLNLASDVFLRDLGTATTRLLSRRTAARPANTGAGFVQWAPRALRHDGSRLAFSTADNVWSPHDTNFYQNIVMVDTGHSRAWAWAPVPGQGEPRYEHRDPMLSADGLFLAYQSRQTSSGFGSNDQDVYLLDVLRFEAGVATPKLLSDRTEAYGRTPSGRARLLDINSDGSQVLFDSPAPVSTFVEGWFPFNDSTNLYLRYTRPISHVVFVVNATPDGMAAGNGHVFGGVFTPDDQWVVFRSEATDLVTNATTAPFIQLFARHIQTATTRLVSHGAGGAGLLDHAAGPVSSGDSRFVLFHADPGFVGYRHDLLSDGSTPNEVVCTNCSDLAANADGTLISYLTRPEPGRAAQVFVRHMTTGEHELVSADPGGAEEGNGDSHSARVSPDGRHVLFGSRATNLAPLDANGTDDIFLRDLEAGATILLSRSIRHGGTGSHRSLEPRFSGDGRLIAFRSFAGDLVPGDYNLTADLFAVTLGEGDSDGDGMDDAWELAYFDTIERDGNGDLDMDGVSDVGEHHAGTDPTDAGSIFQVLTVERVGSGALTLIWSATPGRRYQVEFREGLEEGDWTELGDQVYAAQSTALAVDEPNGSAPRRFYRVRLVE